MSFHQITPIQTVQAWKCTAQSIQHHREAQVINMTAQVLYRVIIEVHVRREVLPCTHVFWLRQDHHD